MSNTRNTFVCLAVFTLLLSSPALAAAQLGIGVQGNFASDGFGPGLGLRIALPVGELIGRFADPSEDALFQREPDRFEAVLSGQRHFPTEHNLENFGYWEVGADLLVYPYDLGAGRLYFGGGLRMGRQTWRFLERAHSLNQPDLIGIGGVRLPLGSLAAFAEVRMATIAGPRGTLVLGALLGR